MAKPDKLMQQWLAQTIVPKPNKASKIKDFKTMFAERARAAGWSADLCDYEGKFLVSIQLTCSHGCGWMEQVSGQLVLFAQQPQAIADIIIGHARQACDKSHEAVPEPTNLVWYTSTINFTSYTSSWNTYGTNPVVEGLGKLVPSISTETAKCPVCLDHTASILNLIPHINDTHKWSREAIADWLDTLDINLTIRPHDKEEVTADAPDDPQASPSVSIQGSKYDFVIYDDIVIGNKQLTGVA